jgi:hypothetical protein
VPVSGRLSEIKLDTRDQALQLEQPPAHLVERSSVIRQTEKTNGCQIKRSGSGDKKRRSAGNNARSTSFVAANPATAIHTTARMTAPDLIRTIEIHPAHTTGTHPTIRVIPLILGTSRVVKNIFLRAHSLVRYEI